MIYLGEFFGWYINNSIIPQVTLVYEKSQINITYVTEVSEQKQNYHRSFKFSRSIHIMEKVN